MEVITALAKTLDKELRWFQTIVNARMKTYFENPDAKQDTVDAAPDLSKDTSEYAVSIKKHALGNEERLALILALAPSLQPSVLDVFLIKNQSLNTEFSEFGGIKNATKHGFVPTLETALFILGGTKLEVRLQLLDLFSTSNPLFRSGILKLPNDQDNLLQSPLQPTHEYLSLFTTGKKALPEYSTSFPAKRISTPLDEKALIVQPQVRNSLDEIEQWMFHADKILNEWDLEKNLKPGYRALFYGPPGTGKTLAATLLGKATKQPVFRIDLSMVVSKYIGETEKNLGKLFDEAENKKWILFFDEADALFGKRTQTKGANDRYANQEVAYLLQRIEDFSGLVILATNIQSNIDDAFSRRFQAMIHFAKPTVAERILLWKQLFGESFKLSEEIDLDTLASNYELTGGEMINVLRYCALEAAKRNEKKIVLTDIITGIRREYSKQNKTL
ncbi:MAG TPA: AAA family ATPase [Flavobacteriaceae bacterium]|jgi:hypothetical protein|nr:AAA family ATPase [Flavobacteriaceae bacterium]HBR53825.1 AAA family ATPase [Flavobacteriaceae bacterium]